ncbi:uncharacterized protein LOC6561409 isoform X3 [Drosophila grimshawi]|nr:uncharacterized protein LOC6561409 isoform X3 [Drosophila grimshawi]
MGDLDEKDWIVRQVCCAGYEGMPGNCKPRCTPSCVNAQCTAPQECTCNEGYATVGGRDNSTVGCQPKCHDCRYGDCIAPNTCRCWPAFMGRSLGQGCQPMVEFLMPAERCLMNACNCWQEYSSWTPLLQAATKCVSICQTGDRTQSCLNIEQCVCSRLTRYLVCEGEKLGMPQQYACQVETVTDQKYRFDRINGKPYSEWTAQTDGQLDHSKLVKNGRNAQTDPTVTKYITDWRHNTDGSEWVFMRDTVKPKKHEDHQKRLDPKDQGMLPNRKTRTSITDLINAWKAKPDRDYSDLIYNTDKKYNLDHIDNSDHKDNSDHIVNAEHKDGSQHTDNSDRSIHIQLQANQIPTESHSNQRILEKIKVKKMLKKPQAFKKLGTIILCGIIVLIIIVVSGVVLCFAFYG